MSELNTQFSSDFTDACLKETLDVIRGEVDRAEAVFRGDETNHLRLGDGRITQAASVVEGRVAVRVVVGGREGRSTTSALTKECLAECARLAAARARQASPPVAGRDALVAPPAPIEPAPEWAVNHQTAHLDAETKGQWLAEGVRAHARDGLALAGRFHSGLSTRAVHSTTGTNAYHQGSWADLSLSALERPAGHQASSFRSYFGAEISAAVVDEMQETVRHECHRAHDPVEVELGPWDVVLAPAAVADLLNWLGTIGFRSRAFDDGTSFVANRIGESITGSVVTIFDDGRMPHRVGVPVPFDAEGQPKRRVSLVEGGVAKGIVHDTRSGHCAGLSSTGHAGGDSSFDTGGGSMPSHLHLAPGTSSLEGLIGSVDRGLFITRFHYVNGMIAPRRAVMTGLLRDGAFLIEGGRLGRSVRSMRFTEPMLEAFARIADPSGLSREVQAFSEWGNSQVSYVVPAMRIPGFTFTSGR
jgi:PmbA protein